MKKHIITIVLFSGMNFGVLAQEMKHSYLAEKFDVNHDNKVTKEEFLASAAQRFKYMDINGDLSISIAEFLQRYHEHEKSGEKMPAAEDVARKVFAKLDLNKDEQITQTEYETARLNWFLNSDKNHDNQISTQE